MIETKEKEINGSLYSVTQMPAMRALRMQAKLGKILGASFALLCLAEANDKSEDGKEADEKTPEALKLLFLELDEKTFENIVLELMQGVRKDGKELTKQVIDFEFSGNLNELYLLLWYILEVNYADFFREGSILSKLKNQKKEKEEKPVLVMN